MYMFYPVIWICGDCYWDWHLDMRLQRVLAVASLFRVYVRYFFFRLGMVIDELLVRSRYLVSL
jgi:hypothetical protein